MICLPFPNGWFIVALPTLLLLGFQPSFWFFGFLPSTVLRTCCCARTSTQCLGRTGGCTPTNTGGFQWVNLKMDQNGDIPRRSLEISMAKVIRFGWSMGYSMFSQAPYGWFWVSAQPWRCALDGLKPPETVWPWESPIFGGMNCLLTSLKGRIHVSWGKLWHNYGKITIFHW